MQYNNIHVFILFPTKICTPFIANQMHFPNRLRITNITPKQRILSAQYEFVLYLHIYCCYVLLNCPNSPKK